MLIDPAARRTRASDSALQRRVAVRRWLPSREQATVRSEVIAIRQEMAAIRIHTMRLP
jgi:hypothetical protein